MKKTSLMLIISLSALLMLSGCQNLPEPEVSESPATETEVETDPIPTEETEEESEDEIVVDVEVETEDETETELAGAKAAAADDEYTLEEMLEYALEDERLALAEYEAIIARFGEIRPFTNIMEAEQKHEEYVIGLYELYGLEVPEFDTSTYIHVPDTLPETFAIGVMAEIDNIAMYDSFLEQDLDDEVREVFQSLRDASDSHLEAFQRNNDKYQ